MSRSRREMVVGSSVLIVTTAAIFLLTRPVSPVEAVRRLVESGKLIGVTEAELHSRYGPSGDAAYFKDWDDRFIIGPEESYFAIDNSWLVARYDGERRLREARVVVD